MLYNLKIIYVSLSLLFTISYSANSLIDVVIPCHAKDVYILNHAIEAIQKYGKNIRRIIVISEYKLTEKAEWFDEKNFPFNKQDIAEVIFNTQEQRNTFLQNKRISGWIYQQLLKLYVLPTIPNLVENVLMLDADTIFLQPVEFIDETDNALYCTGIEYHQPYFAHMQRIIPTLQRVFPHYSGIAHHMLMQQHVIADLFEHIINIHGIEPWKALCKCIDVKQLTSQSKRINNYCMSEYEIYFNFIFSRNYKVKIRPLRWINTHFSAQEISKKQRDGFHFICCHTITC